MLSPDGEREPIEVLADEFVARCRRGELPTAAEYAGRHPDLAEAIHDLFPTLLLLEERRAGVGQAPPAASLQQLNEYRIVRELGRGGMGVVYEAVQEPLGRRVALKVLPAPVLLDPAFLERFRREAQAAARLSHPHIVPVYGVGERDGIHYYAMQFIPGQGLDALVCGIRRRRACAATDTEPALAEATDPDTSVGDPPEDPAAAPEWVSSPQKWLRQAARIGIQAAEALAHAHGQGILHRDIKPSNLLLDHQGQIWITDFGLAKMEGQESMSHTGDLVGTLRYMAPERFAGWADPRSDLYSLGLTLYELLTLRHAFDAPDRAALLRQVMEQDPLLPRKVDRQIPRDLETIVLKAIAREPAQRYASGTELAEDLRRFLEGRPIRARRSTAWEHAWRWCRRNPVMAVLGASVVVLLAAVAVVASLAAFRLDREQTATLANLHRAEEAEQEAGRNEALELVAKQEARQAEGKARAAEREAMRRLQDARLAQALVSRSSALAGRRHNSLQALAEAAGLQTQLQMGTDDHPHLRNEAIACLVLADLRAQGQHQVPLATRNAVGVFDDALQLYAQAEGTPAAVVVRSFQDDAERVRLPRTADAPQAVAFSRDGRLLATRGRRKEQYLTTVWDLVRRQALVEVPAYHADLAPDGRSAAFAQPDGSIAIYDLATRKETTRQGPILGPFSRIAYHPDGGRLAVASRQEVRVLDLKTSLAGEILSQAEPVVRLCWHPGGRLLATVCGDAVYLWDTETGKQSACCRGHQAKVVGVAFSNRGDLLATAGADATVRLWEVRTGSQLVSIPAQAQQVQFSPDDRQVGYRGASPDGFRHHHGVLEVAAGREWRVLDCPEGQPQATAISPDGRLLVGVGAAAGIRVHDVRAGRELAPLPLQGTASAAFAPDGSLLTYTRSLGLHRWAIGPADTKAEGRLRIGPPLPLPLSEKETPHSVSLSPEGRTALVQLSGTLEIHDLDQGTVRSLPHAAFAPLAIQIPPASPLKPKIASPGPNPKLFALAQQANASTPAITPDGRWLATGTGGGTLVTIKPQFKLWDGGTGKPGPVLAGAESLGVAFPMFSADGKWLVARAAGEYRFWEVGSWKPGPRVLRAGAEDTTSPLAFSPDGTLAALEPSLGVVKLIHLATGREAATLPATPAGNIRHLGFSPDGTLLAAATANGTIQLWNLRAIREQLATLGLDWSPAVRFPASAPADGKVLQVELVGAELLKPSVK